MLGWIGKKLNEWIEGIIMATSSILKNFIISDNEQAEIFANAIEVSYQESLQMKKDEEMVMYEELKNPDEIRDFMEEWKLLHE